MDKPTLLINSHVASDKSSMLTQTEIEYQIFPTRTDTAQTGSGLEWTGDSGELMTNGF